MDESRKKINLALFEAYKNVYGNVHIRADFVIPYEAPWPQEIHGLKLGNLAARIRNNLKKPDYYDSADVERLLDLGFKLNYYEHKIDNVLLAFQTFHKLHGHCHVPRTFVIAENDFTWPEDTRGILLGEKLYGIRKKKLHKSIHNELRALGADLEEHPKYLGRGFDRIFQALTAYKKLYGDFSIPRSFVIQQDDTNFPVETWGLKLGNALYSMQAKGKYLDRRQELSSIGLTFGTKNSVGFRVIFEALQSFKAMYGDVLVPKQYIVPQNDPGFAPEAWGLKLGNCLQSIRNHGSYAEHKEELLALGVSYESMKRRRPASERAPKRLRMDEMYEGTMSDEDD